MVTPNNIYLHEGLELPDLLFGVLVEEWRMFRDNSTHFKHVGE